MIAPLTPLCPSCRRPVPPPEAATYGGRCEDCWSAQAGPAYGERYYRLGKAAMPLRVEGHREGRHAAS